MEAMTKAPSLKRLVGLGATLSAVVALGSFVVLGYMSYEFHQSSTLLSESTESIVLVSDAELDLLLIERTVDPIVRQNIERVLRRRLDLAESFVSTPEEGALLRETRKALAAYLTARPPMSREAALSLFQQAQHGLSELSAVNVLQGRTALAQVRDTSRVAVIVGFSVLALLVSTLSFIGLWIQRNAALPLYRLASAMDAFARRSPNVRVQEEGAAELRDIARRFNDMADALARQDQARLTYLAGVAHDLRNPLTALQVSTALLGPDRPLPPEAKLRRLLATVQGQIRRLHRMVGDLLEGTRIEAGHLDLHRARTDLRTIARATHELYAESSPDHELSLELPDEECPADVDAERIEQALNNLVSNAVKYSPHGGVVRIALRRQGGEAELSVSDDGIGVNHDDRERIFEPFQRAGGSHEIASGVGLGLSVVRRIVEGHGGRITVHSVPGAGSTFSLHLPLAASSTDETTFTPRHSSETYDSGSSHALR